MTPPPPGGGREDCWSEEETGALIDEWGDRYLQLSRGILRQKDWSEVADAVNARLEALGRPRKTDSQCKNRIDTIKKRYKAEKSRRPGPSQWPFFSRLDLLMGFSDPSPLAKKPAAKPQPSRRPSLNFTLKNRSPTTPAPAVYSSSRSRLDSPVPSESSRDDGDADENDDYKDERLKSLYEAVAAGKRRRSGGLSGGRRIDGATGVFGELAKAILNFTDVYERVELSKQDQMMELERQRMEFSKELEFRRMQTFMEAQVEIEKMKGEHKHAPGSGKGHSKEN